MRRSEINRYIQEAIGFCRRQNFHLPFWSLWSPRQWEQAGHEADEIRQRMLGWDVTDFGSGDFASGGLLLFTIRNGPPGGTRDPMAKDYCEKLLLVGEDQVTPTHFHFAKMEDIINRAGGTLVMELWQADRATEQPDLQSPVTVAIDGIRQAVVPGQRVLLEPGQSITLPPYLYHRFHALRGAGMVLGGEVSRVNDDARDNRFQQPLPRFPAIEEDAPPLHLLCMEYPPAR